MTLKILNNTHEKFHQSNLGKLKELLVNNNYPRAMIKIAIDASVEKWHRTNSNTNLNLDEATGNKRFMRRKTLSLEIKVTAWMLMKTGKTLGKLEAEVQVKIGAQRFELLASIRKSRYDQEFRKIKKANIKKLKNLSSSQASIIVNTQQKCVFNFTDVVLPEEVNRILTLEPNFGLPVTNKDVKPVLFIKDIEYALDQVNIEGMDLVSLNDEKSNIRGRVFHQSNLGKLKELLVNNNYPRAMIKIAIDASVEKWHRTNSNTNLNLDEATGNKRFM
ncbi:hypothetical protein KQX54_000314, partial [Cotesia glomerata]